MLHVSVDESHDYCAAPQTAEDKLKSALEYINKLEEIISKQKIDNFGINRFSDDPDMVRFYTGFTSYNLFKFFYDSIVLHAVEMITWNQMQRYKTNKTKKINQSYKSKLILIDQLFLSLHKFRLGSLDQDLADKFDVSQSTVSRNTITWSNFIYVILGSQNLWPTKSQIQAYMPSTFKASFPSTRVIIDCTEIKVQTPSSLVLNSELYSHYKGTTTLKGLIGITPAGAVSFISSLYMGSISDTHITRVCGMLELLEPGDQVMADKGFLIQDLLLERQCTLVMPNFLKLKGQFSKDETSQNELIANLRVHVERAIRRVREYHIFDAILPLNMAGTANQIWACCCMLTNFQGPLIKRR